jgi:hypothetical protein
MRRIAIVAAGVLAAAAVGAGAAIADQSPGGHLGNPDSIARGSGIWDIPIVVPTDSCSGFTAANSLVFTNVSVQSMIKVWRTPPPGYEWADGWYELSTKLNGSAVVGGQTYSLRADLDLSRPYSETSAHGDGMLIVTRSDGARMRGSAALVEWDFATLHYNPAPPAPTWHDEFAWSPTDLRCK